MVQIYEIPDGVVIEVDERATPKGSAIELIVAVSDGRIERVWLLETGDPLVVVCAGEA